MSGDEIGPIFAERERKRRDGHVDEAIQGVDLSLDAAALRDIHHGKAGRISVSPVDHISAPENTLSPSECAGHVRT